MYQLRIGGTVDQRLDASHAAGGAWDQPQQRLARTGASFAFYKKSASSPYLESATSYIKKSDWHQGPNSRAHQLRRELGCGAASSRRSGLRRDNTHSGAMGMPLVLQAEPRLLGS